MSSVSTLVLLLASLGGAPRGEVLDFSATWCGPCQQMSPIVSRLEREGLPIRKVDVERERELAERLHVRSIPTFVLLVGGKEVHRLVGLTSETELRRLIAQVPVEPDPPQTLLASTQPTAVPPSGHAVAPPEARDGKPRASLGEPLGTVPPPSRQEPERNSMFDFLRPRDRQPEPEVLRGNDPEPAAPAASYGPMAASVRLHVTIGGNISVGSGTVVESHRGRTLIITCGHIFRGMDRSSKVDVDLFDGNTHHTYLGTVVRYDEQADVGLVSIPTDVAVASTPIAPPDSPPQRSDRVFCIGCSGGAEPTREQLRVTAINKYTGPDNIECTGVPVQGRSGGGLFDSQDRLIGVCIAADQETQHGLYAHAFAIHALLDECNLTYLYQPRAVADPDLAFVRNEPAVEPASLEQAAAVPPEPDANAFTSAPVAAPAEGVNDIPAGDAEVVVIIRPRNQPNAPSRIVIINQASPKFFSYLNDELPQATEAMTAHRVPATGLVETTRQTAADPQPPRRHESRRTGAGGGDAVPNPIALPARRQVTKEALKPTALSQPAPRAYVRSAGSR